MRKTQMALAAVALVASTAAMADVAVSGRFDYGYATSTGSAVSGIQGSLLAPNFVTVSGSEDLGNGLKASFNWRNIVGNAGGLANANSEVGIGTDTVGVKLGRVTDDFLQGVCGFDVTGCQNIGSAVSPILQFGATGAFHSNAVQVNGSGAGVNFGATYIAATTAAAAPYDATAASAANGPAGAPAIAIGDTVNPGRAGAKGDYSLRASTEFSGIRVGVAYAQRTSSLTTETGTAGAFTATKHSSIGVGTNFGDLAANLLYMNLDTTTVTGVNGSYPVITGTNLVAGYYNYSNSTDSAKAGTLYSVGLRHALSKQTTAFANYEKGSGGAGVMVGSNLGATPANGVAILGLAHSF
jgi:hypothetical protein